MCLCCVNVLFRWNIICSSFLCCFLLAFAWLFPTCFFICNKYLCTCYILLYMYVFVLYKSMILHDLFMSANNNSNKNTCLFFLPSFWLLDWVFIVCVVNERKEQYYCLKVNIFLSYKVYNIFVWITAEMDWGSRTYAYKRNWIST